jgi:hypothetical protein
MFASAASIHIVNWLQELKNHFLEKDPKVKSELKHRLLDPIKV